MVLFPIPGCILAIYTPIKDLCLYLKDKSEEIEDLKERLRALRLNLASIISRKEDIDRILQTSVTKDKSKEYEAKENEFTRIRKDYTKFICRYARITGKPDIATTELDDSFAALVMEKFEEIESTIWTLKFFKLTKLSRDIAKLDKRALLILGSLKDTKHMMHNIAEPHQEKLFHDNDLPVFNEYVDAIFRHLSGKKNRVGVIGPPGVGKTIVMWKLYNQLIDKKSSGGLDNIIWIQEKGTAEKLQEEIMLQLQIHHEKTDSMLMNANNISAFLRERKYILLMDHVSEKLDLNNLGIRGDHEYGNVVIASYDKKAISSMIKDEVKIERLNPENAWFLFESICGEVKDVREGIGRVIVNCCGGLPREIKSVATYLKDHPDESSWLHIKKTIQSPTGDMNNIVFAGFDLYYKSRYEELEKSYKKCFLYASLFPYEEIIHRDYLIECWMAECFLENKSIVQQLRDSRDSGQGVLDKLTRLFLLDWCSDRKRVMMPSICRTVALQAYADDENCSTWVPSDHAKPNEETWKTVRRMSLIGCKTELPQSPECSNICTLLLRSKPELDKIPDSFFSHMDALLVLDVFDTKIRLLPSSINKLVNLKILYLNSCKHLQALPTEAADLKKLQCLDIRGTSILTLPQEIGKMFELRCLRASFSPKAGSFDVIIPLNIIKNLRKLEELTIDTGLFSPPAEMAEELAKELAGLQYLTTLRFNFPNLGSFNTFVTLSESLRNRETTWESSTFRSFKISVGRCDETLHPYESDILDILAERQLRFSVNGEFSSPCHELSKQASAFELIGNQSVETLSKFDLHSVQVCVVGNCSRLKSIVEAGDRIQEIVDESSRGVLQSLKKLHLYNLPVLQCVWKGMLSPQSLVNLVILTLNGCPELTEILDLASACALPSLKHLKVENCCNVSKIVEVPEESSASGMLNSVETIEMINLSNLLSVCSSRSLSWDSLNSMVIRGCNKLNNLSLTKTNAPRLASIECVRWQQDHLSLADVYQRKLPFKEESFELGEMLTDSISSFDPAPNNNESDAADHQASNNNKSGTADHQRSKMNAGDYEESHEEKILIHENHQASGCCLPSFHFVRWKGASSFQPELNDRDRM